MRRCKKNLGNISEYLDERVRKLEVMTILVVINLKKKTKNK